MPAPTFASFEAFAGEVHGRLADLRRRTPNTATHFVDQYEAAAAEVAAAHQRVYELADAVAPGLFHEQHTEQDDGATVTAAIYTSMDGFRICSHLRLSRSPEPVVVNLALERCDCRRCARTLRKPPVEHLDRCDLCRQHGHIVFKEFSVQVGPFMAFGNVCPDCTDLLGLQDGR